MVKAAKLYSAARRWLTSGQYTIVGHEAYAVGQADTRLWARLLLLLLLLLLGWHGVAWD